jgi:hypothetical protein
VLRHVLGMGSRESLHWEEGVIGVVVIGVSLAGEACVSPGYGAKALPNVRVPSSFALCPGVRSGVVQHHAG